MYQQKWGEKQFTQAEVNKVKTHLVKLGSRFVELEYTDRPEGEELFSASDIYNFGEVPGLQWALIKGSGYLNFGRTLQFWLGESDDDLFL